MKKIVIALLALTLGGCVSGQAEFTNLPGEPRLTEAQLIRAKGYCKMRARDEASRQIALYGPVVGPNPEIMIDDAEACFASQGVRLKGWRQDDGTLTRRPVKPLTPMARRSLVIPE